MKIKVPTEEESQKAIQTKRRNFLFGLVVGIILFGLIGSRVFWYGLDSVELYTWIALGFGAISFGLLAMWFGGDFWRTLFRGD